MLQADTNTREKRENNNKVKLIISSCRELNELEKKFTFFSLEKKANEQDTDHVFHAFLSLILSTLSHCQLDIVKKRLSS